MAEPRKPTLGILDVLRKALGDRVDGLTVTVHTSAVSHDSSVSYREVPLADVLQDGIVLRDGSSLVFVPVSTVAAIEIVLDTEDSPV